MFECALKKNAILEECNKNLLMCLITYLTKYYKNLKNLTNHIYIVYYSYTIKSELKKKHISIEEL
jgi:hypothetical protein